MVKSMEIRKYQSSDLKVICELFYETINTINRYDYNTVLTYHIALLQSVFLDNLYVRINDLNNLSYQYYHNPKPFHFQRIEYLTNRTIFIEMFKLGILFSEIGRAHV